MLGYREMLVSDGHGLHPGVSAAPGIVRLFEVGPRADYYEDLENGTNPLGVRRLEGRNLRREWRT